LKLRKCLLDDIAEMASVARIHYHVVHTEILNADFYRAAVVRGTEIIGPATSLTRFFGNQRQPVPFCGPSVLPP
jgi:hypothetical protein